MPSEGENRTLLPPLHLLPAASFVRPSSTQKNKKTRKIEKHPDDVRRRFYSIDNEEEVIFHLTSPLNWAFITLLIPVHILSSISYKSSSEQRTWCYSFLMSERNDSTKKVVSTSVCCEAIRIRRFYWMSLRTLYVSKQQNRCFILRQTCNCYCTS